MATPTHDEFIQKLFLEVKLLFKIQCSEVNYSSVRTVVQFVRRGILDVHVPIDTFWSDLDVPGDSL